MKPIIICNNLQGGYCYGTPASDTLIGDQAVDHIYGGAGDDNIPCEFTAFVDPQAALTGGPGKDIEHGGPGNDTCYGDPGDTIVNCEKVIRFAGPLLVNPSGPVPLPRALGGPLPNLALPLVK